MAGGRGGTCGVACGSAARSPQELCESLAGTCAPARAKQSDAAQMAQAKEAVDKEPPPAKGSKDAQAKVAQAKEIARKTSEEELARAASSLGEARDDCRRVRHACRRPHAYDGRRVPSRCRFCV